MITMHRHTILLLLTASAALFSCQKEEETIQEEQQAILEDNTVCIDMVLNGGIHFWDAPQTKAVQDWPNGSSLYIQFYNDNGVYQGKATYQSDPGTWKLNIDPIAIVNTTGGTCECYYFGSWSDISSKRIRLSDSSPIYEGWGDYTVSGNNVTLNVTLAPKTGRIRFFIPSTYTRRGHIHGLSYYTQFDLSTFTFTQSEDKYLDIYIDYRNENPDYMYCFFTYPDNTVINGYSEGWFNSHYERSFDASMLAPGHSVVCEWPEENAHNEWIKYENQYYPLRDSFDGSYTEFNFIDAGVFAMGGRTASPIHTVRLTHNYYLQRWETARSLWYYALGKPSGWQNDGNPVVGKTWDEIQEFIFALNVKTGQNYRLPTEAEWEWACRGSWWNSIDNSVSAFRGGPIQRPGWSNSIDMYDMCGNAGEFVQDWYGPYTAAEQTNPEGPATGDYHVIRGGDITSSDEGVTVYARATEKTALLQYTGFRLAMDVPEMYETYKGAKLYAPSRLPIGNVPVGQTGHSKLTVRASRIEDVTFQIQGSGDGFSFSPSGEITVPAGELREVDFSFTSSQVGEKEASFNVVSSSLAAPISVKVTATGRSDEDALIMMERKYLLRNINNSYSYPRMSICFDNETSILIGYYNTEYYDGWWHGYENRLSGIFIYPTSGGNSYQNRTEEPWNPTGLPETDTWVNEKVLIYPDSDVDYYVNGTYLGTYSFATLDLSAVEKFYVQCSPEGITTNIEHWMDDFSISTSSGYSYTDNFESEKLNTTFWKVPTNPAGVKQEDGVAKTILKRTDDDYNLTSRNINLWQ